MKPSEKKRMLYLKSSSAHFLSMGFHLIALSALVIGMIIVLSDNDLIEDMVRDALFTIVLPVVTFELAALVFVPGAMKIIRKGEQVFEVSNCSIPKEQLLRDAQNIMFPNNNWSAEVNGNWIDFSWNWRNAISVGYLTGSRSVRMFKKMIFVHDNNTYEELDMSYTATINASVGTIEGFRSVQYGHILEKSAVIDIGKDLNSNNVGINKYAVNSTEMADFVHQWLAARGYKRID